MVNIALDLLFVLVLHRGVAGAALATMIAQGLSAAGIALYFFFRLPKLRPRRSNFRLDRPLLSRIASVSVLTSVQQSIMNFGILLVQSLVNSFGVATMAAFAADVKIDSFAYSPAQDFANGFTTFVAQNTGAGKPERVKQGIREAALLSLSFCAVRAGLPLCAAAAHAVHRPRRARDSGRRRALSARGRRVLRRHRPAVSALRDLSRA